MSYILDALKRADADRERGHVPGLHSQMAGLANAGPSGQALTARLTVAQRPAVLAAMGLVVLLASAAAWWWSRPAPPGAAPVTEHRSPSAPDRADTPAAAAPAAAVAPARVQPAPPAPVFAAAPGADAPPVRPATPVLPILAPPAAPPAPVVAAAGPNTSAKAPEKAAATPATNAANAPAKAPARTAPGAGAPAASGAALPAQPVAEPAVRRFADLPPETRAQLPTVSVSGSTYSQNPAHRMLIANGKVVQEGGEIAPGLVLETIGPRSAVLNHRGVRYSIGY